MPTRLLSIASAAVRTSRTKWLLSLVLVTYMIGTVAFFSLFYAPRQREIARLEGEKEATEAAIRRLELMKAELPALERQVAEMGERLVQAAALIPRDTDLPRVLSAVSELASRCRVTIEELSHQPSRRNSSQNVNVQTQAAGNRTAETAGHDVGHVQIDAVVSGSYNSLVAFVSSLEKGFPSLRIGSIQVDPAQTEKAGHGAGFVTAALGFSLGVVGRESAAVLPDGSWADGFAAASAAVPIWRDPFHPYGEELARGEGGVAERESVRLTGVARSSSSLRGVLEIGPKSYMVQTGEKIGDLTVLKVALDGVTLQVDGAEVFLGVGEEW